VLVTGRRRTRTPHTGAFPVTERICRQVEVVHGYRRRAEINLIDCVTTPVLHDVDHAAAHGAPLGAISIVTLTGRGRPGSNRLLDLDFDLGLVEVEAVAVAFAARNAPPVTGSDGLSAHAESEGLLEFVATESTNRCLNFDQLSASRTLLVVGR
jgi:hypothetical protein